MIVRLIKPWKYKKPGTILNGMPDGAANVLIHRGVAEEVRQVEKEQTRGVRAKRA